jgi:hypothetical protein
MPVTICATRLGRYNDLYHCWLVFLPQGYLRSGGFVVEPRRTSAVTYYGYMGGLLARKMAFGALSVSSLLPIVFLNTPSRSFCLCDKCTIDLSLESLRL